MSRFPPLPTLVLSFATLTIIGCQKVKSLEGSLEATVLMEWASEGKIFMGQYWDQPISTVTELPDRTWEVAYPDQSALGGERTWQMQITSLEAYPVFPGAEFARYLNDVAVSINRRGALPQDVRDMVSGGQIEAVGRFEIRARRMDRTSYAPVSRIAILRPRTDEAPGTWDFGRESRSLNVLWQAVRGTYDRLIQTDENVMGCAVDVEASNRALLTECAADELARRFGEG